MHISNNYLNLKQARLAQEISGHGFPAKCFFCSSGAEANEAAIKFARRFGAGTGRYEIITVEKSFHGRTMGAMTATGQPRVQEGFDPLPGGFAHARFNDLISVREKVNEKLKRRGIGKNK